MEILFIPNQPHCYAFGGFEVQMLTAYEGLCNEGVSVKLFDPWKRELSFDIVHIWGLDISQYHNIVYARRAGKKIVVTTLMPDLSSPFLKLKFFISGLIYKAKILKELATLVDVFVAINDFERDLISRYYNFPRERIAVIPNVVSQCYFDNTRLSYDLGISDFVLCVGNITTRKNQLNLVKACNEIGYNVLLIGNVITGEQKYHDLVVRELKKNPNSKIIENVKEGSVILKAAYQQCKIFALLSFLENQPISVLEAIASNCKIVLSDKPYAHQMFYEQLKKVDPYSITSIKEGLLGVEDTTLDTKIIENCTLENVSRKYTNVYQELMNKHKQ